MTENSLTRSPWLKRRALGATAVALAAALALSACGDKPAPAAAAAVRDASIVTLTPELSKLTDVKTLESAEVRDLLRIPGRLEVNANDTSRIGAPITGRIVSLRANLGDDVAVGSVLAEINSPELTNAQLAFLKAHSAEQLQQRAVERARLLLAGDVIGSAELQRRENELTIARAEKRAAADSLRVLGVPASAVGELEANGRILQNAPISATLRGTVIDRQVAQGQVVAPSDVLFVVSDLKTLWAAAELPEQEVGRLKRGESVQVEVAALDDEKIAGKIVFISDTVNPQTRTIRVNVLLDNKDRRLKPAMLTNMLIESKGQKKQVVPATAVVRENDKDHLFVVWSDTVANPEALRQVKLLPVKLGPERNGVRPLLEKLDDKAEVVIKGAFHVNNERNRLNVEQGVDTSGPITSSAKPASAAAPAAAAKPPAPAKP